MNRLNKNLENNIMKIVNTSGTKAKNELVAMLNKTSDEMIIIEFLLNKDKKTHINTKKYQKINADCNSEILGFDKFIQCLSADSRKDEEVSIIKNTIINSDISEEFGQGLVTKSLKLGISASAVNKIRPNTFEDYQVMLGKKFETRLIIGETATITQKLDGVRMTAYINNGEVIFRTRQGKFKQIPEIEQVMVNFPNGIYDGELLDLSEEFGETISKTNSKNVIKGCKFVMFDYIPFIGSEMPYIERFNQLITNTSDFINSPFLEIVRVIKKSWHINGSNNDFHEYNKIMKMVDDNGWEGVMVSIDNSPYTFSKTRTKNLMKVKKFHTLDLKCTGVNIAIDGKHKGLIGALEFQYKGNKLFVGSGLSDELRNKDEDYFLNKIIEIGYFEETIDSKTGLQSLRFPTFKQMRFDKTEESFD